jgi:hypothetical protein
MTQTATEKLIDRMLNYKQPGSLPFDGYPSMDCFDEGMIEAALGCGQNEGNPIIMLSYLASENVKTRQQYESAKAYIADYVDTVWHCNMNEGSNALYEELSEV